MNHNFRCTNCGCELRRPAQPYTCPKCGRQAVGLFQRVQEESAPQQPAALPPPGGAPAGAGETRVEKLPAPPAVAAAPTPPPLRQPVRTPGASGGTPTSAGPSRPNKTPVLPTAKRLPPMAPSAKRAPAVPRPVVRPPADELPNPKTTPGVTGSAPGTTGSARGATGSASAAATQAAPPPRARPLPIRPQQFVWAYPAEPPFEDQARPLRTAPAVDAAGTIYVHAAGRLVALVEEEGRPRVVWEYVTGAHLPGPIVVASDGTIRLHCSDGLLHCLTAAGKQRWAPASVGQPLGWAAPAVDAAGNTWISAYDGGLIKVDAEGRVPATRFFRCRPRLDSAGIIHRDVFYVGSEEGYVFAIDLHGPHGRNLWDQTVDQGHTGWFVNTALALTADETLVAAAGDEHLYGFTLNGRTLWRVKMPGAMLGSPVIDPQGHVYVGVAQSQRGQPPRGLLVSVDGNSHKIRWEYAAAAAVESTPAIGDDDLLYFGDNAGMIHALDFRGQAQWTARVEAPVRSAGTILAPERLAFGLDNETLVVLRCSSAGLAAAGWPKIGGNDRPKNDLRI